MRPDLQQPPVTPHVAEKLARYRPHFLDQVRAAIGENDVVVVGMGWNPHVARAVRDLNGAEIAHIYVGHGNYVTGWRDRLSVKLWSGWPTFPQIFVRGTLIGGGDQVRHMLEDGSLRELLGQ